MGLFVLSLVLYPLIGSAYFPRTDPGQFVINVKAPSGTRLEVTDKLSSRSRRSCREEVEPEDLDLVVSNIGITPDFSAIYTSNSGQHTAFVQVSLKEGHRIGSYEYMDRVRRRFAKEVPQVTAYFQSGGLVDAVLNLGLPAPIDIQVSGSNLEATHRHASEIARKVRAAARGERCARAAGHGLSRAAAGDRPQAHAAELGLSHEGSHAERHHRADFQRHDRAELLGRSEDAATTTPHRAVSRRIGSRISTICSPFRSAAPSHDKIHAARCRLPHHARHLARLRSTTISCAASLMSMSRPRRRTSAGS